MTDNQIIQEVLRYLEDDAYRYAVLIDGEWGSGKTYFVKNHLITEIDKHEQIKDKARKIKYISLYGCKTVQDIQENIVWCVAEDIPQKVFEKCFPAKLRKKKTTNSANQAGVAIVTRKIANAVIKLKSPKTNPYELVSDWLNIKNYVFVFDDIERCSCPINEAFGFINGLVEHEGVKVILVANEEEICRVTDNSSDALEYLVAVQNEIKWPNEETSLGNHKSGESKVELRDLEKRRNNLFPQKDMTGDYRKIREKLIGVTLRYSPDMPGICTTMVKQAPLTVEKRSVLLEQMGTIQSVVRLYNHHNLRTFQFFLSKITYLMEQIDNCPVPDKMQHTVLSEVANECFRATVKYKANVRPPKWEQEQNVMQGIKFPSIRVYVEKGEFQSEIMNNEVADYVKELENAITADDPFNLLSNEFYLHPQTWCQEKMALLLNRLRDNEYPRHMYLRIIVLLCRMKKYGFSQKYLDDAKKYMIKNVERVSDAEIIETNFLHLFDDEIELGTQIKQIAEDINQAITESNGQKRQSSITGILKDEKWASELEEYLNPRGEMYYTSEEPVFCQADCTLWMEAIKNSSLEEINIFRSLLGRIYPHNYRKESAKSDIPILRKISEMLESNAETDLIRKTVLGWLKEQLDEIVNVHTDA